ncbi:MAG TPA: hypothetical protein VJ904_12800, partial [Tichowtungia sp.]|nr:hypothetical protein [Tichowtungia sp.]
DLLHRTAGRSEVPIIGSLNGFHAERLADCARRIQDAGAQGLELNLYHIAANPDGTGREIERRYMEAVQAVQESVTIPLAVKLSPYFSSLGHMIRRIDHLHVDALVLFDRFCQPDFNIVSMEIEANMAMSGPEEIRLPLRWIAMMRGLTETSLAASTGVESGAEVIKYLLAGADAVMTASALLQNGPEYIGTLIRDLAHWMEKNEYESVSEFQSRLSQRGVPNPDEFERINYIRVIETYTKNYLQKDNPPCA